MKKCSQCGQVLSDDSKFCFKCGGSSFEPIPDSGSGQQQGFYQQPPQQQPYYQQQSSYQQQPYYQQPPQRPYPQQVYDNTAPARIKDFLIFYLLMLIPIFNIVYLIMVAVGGPRYNVSLTNYVRATLIWALIIFAVWLILFLIIGSSLLQLFSGGYYYSY